MEELEITNYRRRRKWGWGWTTTPTGEDAYSIEIPKSPDYVGTLNQLEKDKANDAAFNNLGGAFYNTAQFWDGKRITHTWAFANLTPTVTPNGEWIEDVKYGYRWVAGFHPPDDQPDVKIRVAN